VYQHLRQPKVSIIILAKDALDWLDRCLRRLLSQTVYPDYEVLIVDCGSGTIRSTCTPNWRNGIRIASESSLPKDHF